MNVILGFPFRGPGDRQKIFDLVQPIVSGLYPFDEIVVMDSGHPQFNRAATRNKFAQYAIDQHYDVAVCCDADSIPDQEVLEEAIEQAYDESEIRIPFDIVRVIGLGRFIGRPDKYARLRPTRSYGPSCGGIYVFRPGLWRDVGGMDERVEGWGFEDRIFLSALKTFHHGPVFHVGNLYNIDHRRDLSSLEYAPNCELMDRYHAAEGKNDEFKLIRAGSNGFCPD